MAQLYALNSETTGSIYDQLAHVYKIRHPSFRAPHQLITREQLSGLIDTAFWASVRSNEGRATRVSAAVVTRDYLQGAQSFLEPVNFDESQIVKLSPSVPPGGCLTISSKDKGFEIWGISRWLPPSLLELLSVEISNPGVVRVNIGPYQPFAVLTSGKALLVEGTRIGLAHHIQSIRRKPIPTDDPLETQAVWRECLALADLCRTILESGHGGIVLVVPQKSGRWTDCLQPFTYQFTTPDRTIPAAIRDALRVANDQGKTLEKISASNLPDELKQSVWSLMAQPRWDVRAEVRAVAAFAGVDGAIVMTRDLDTLGYGATISVRMETPPQICKFSPEPGLQPVILCRLEDLQWGTRHQSAARFVDANRDSFALVISQDRRMSVMHWNESVTLPDGSIGCVAVVQNAEWLG